jgi:starvation-inducible DNA-binding protein
MTNSLNVVGAAKDISSGLREPKTLAEGLTNVLADTYRLTFKSHAVHWNVEGPMFFAVHSLTEAQYEDMFAAADKLAERIRAIGQMAPMAMSQIMSASVIEDPEGTPSAGEMCRMLAEDHQRIAYRLHALIEIADEKKDPVTEDLATERSAFHEQAAWMLRALATE